MAKYPKMKKNILVVVLFMFSLVIFCSCQRENEYQYTVYMKDGNIIYAWQMENDDGMTWIVDEKGHSFYINTQDIKKVENCTYCRKEK